MVLLPQPPEYSIAAVSHFTWFCNSFSPWFPLVCKWFFILAIHKNHTEKLKNWPLWGKDTRAQHYNCADLDVILLVSERGCHPPSVPAVGSCLRWIIHSLQVASGRHDSFKAVSGENLTSCVCFHIPAYPGPTVGACPLPLGSWHLVLLSSLCWFLVFCFMLPWAQVPPVGIEKVLATSLPLLSLP